MAEGGIGTEVTMSYERDSSQDVKDSWFNDYLKGNSRFPQTNREGIGSLLTDAVLKDPPDTWDHFFDTDVTEDQVDRIGKAMNSHHRKAEVRYSTEYPLTKDAALSQRILSKVKREGRFQITPERLQNLWVGSTEEVGRVILGFINNKYYYPGTTIDSEIINDISFFFNDPHQANRVDVLRQTMALVSDAVNDDQGKKISENYKREVSAKSSAQGRWLYEIKQHVASTVREQFPEENLEWLYGKWEMSE